MCTFTVLSVLICKLIVFTLSPLGCTKAHRPFHGFLKLEKNHCLEKNPCQVFMCSEGTVLPSGRLSPIWLSNWRPRAASPPAWRKRISYHALRGPMARSALLPSVPPPHRHDHEPCRQIPKQINMPSRIAQPNGHQFISVRKNLCGVFYLDVVDMSCVFCHTGARF